MSILTNRMEPRTLGLCLGSVELSPVLFMLGVLATALGLAMIGPALLDFVLDERDWREFLMSSSITVFCGLMLVAANARRNMRLDLRQGFVLTVLAWVTLGFFGGLPFWFSNDSIGFSDAIFESISGLTTTGATVFIGLEGQPPGILLWRSLLQWIGGIGIIGMAITLLPALRVGGMQLFRMESSDTTEHGMTRFAGLGLSIVVLYVGMTAVVIGGYLYVGVLPFDAICLGMTTISTGGFANTDASVGLLSNGGLWFAVLGMILGSLPYLLYVRAVRGRPQAIFTDPQVNGFLGLLLVCGFLMGVWVWTQTDLHMFDALTRAFFSVTSIMTTTGLIYEDYTEWGSFAILLFFLLMFVGGCTGSTTGGIKIFRFQVALIVLSTHIRKRYLPHAVVLPTYGGRPVDGDVSLSVALFFFAMGATTWVLTLVLALLGNDWVTALSGAVAAVCNVGPGLGDVIGPVGTYHDVTTPTKWVLAMGMVMGRLEMFTFLVLLDRRFWRP